MARPTNDPNSRAWRRLASGQIVNVIPHISVQKVSELGHDQKDYFVFADHHLAEVNLQTHRVRWSLYTNWREINYYRHGSYTSHAPGDDGVDNIAQLRRAIEASREFMAPELANRIHEFLTPQALGVMAGFAALYVGSQLTPVGWAADAMVAVLFVGGCLLMGSELLEIARLLKDFYQTATTAGQDPAKYRQAGRYFAQAVTKIGVDVLLAVLLHKAQVPLQRKLVRLRQGSGTGRPTVAQDPPPANMTNAQKGVYGEHVSDVYMHNRGYQKLNDGGTLTPSTGGARGTGIDGVWRNPSPPPEYVITEAKYGTSKLGDTADGKQMSDDWVTGGNRLERAVGDTEAAKIRRAMRRGEVRKEIHRIDQNGNITVKELDEDGNIIN